MKLNVVKKLIVSTALLASFSSQAMVAVFSWDPPMMGAGMIVGVFGSAVANGGLIATEYLYEQKNPIVKSGVIITGLVTGVGAIVAFLGGVVLEDGTVSMEFYPVKEADHQLLGITAEEAAIYNSELDQVNVITHQMALDLNKIEKPTVEDSTEVFLKYKSLVSEETSKVMAKIALTMFKK
ncbi:MAG: hypothetical protein AB7I27_07995 [Bacteriovoracaceae bacterium]